MYNNWTNNGLLGDQLQVSVSKRYLSSTGVYLKDSWLNTDQFHFKTVKLHAHRNLEILNFTLELYSCIATFKTSILQTKLGKLMQIQNTHIIRPRWGDKKVSFWTEFQRADGIIWRCLNFYILHGVFLASKTESIRSCRSWAKCSKTWRATESCARWAEHACQIAMQCFRFLLFSLAKRQKPAKTAFHQKTRKLLSAFDQF